MLHSGFRICRSPAARLCEDQWRPVTLSKLFILPGLRHSSTQPNLSGYFPAAQAADGLQGEERVGVLRR